MNHQQLEHRKDFILRFLSVVGAIWEESLYLEYWLEYKNDKISTFNKILTKLQTEHLIERGGNKVCIMLYYNGKRMNEKHINE